MSKLKYVVFILGSCIICFFLGLYLGSLLVPQGAGLAGGAIVMMYGIGGFLFGLIISLILSKYLPGEVIKRANWVISIAALAIVARLIYGWQMNQKEIREHDPVPKELKSTEPVQGSVGKIKNVN